MFTVVYEGYKKYYNKYPVVLVALHVPRPFLHRRKGLAPRDYSVNTSYYIKH